MLIRNLWGRSLTNTLFYTFQLKKETVNTYFNNNFKEARQQITKVSNQIKLNKDQSRKFFHYYPRVFRQNSKQFQQVKQRIENIKRIAAEPGKRGEIGKILTSLMFQSNNLIFEMTEKQQQQFVQTVDKYFESAAQVQTILTACPNLINNKFQIILEEKLVLMNDYLQLSNQQAMKIFESSPFLLPASLEKIRSSLVTLHKVFMLSKQEVIEQMKSMGQIFLLGTQNIKDAQRNPVRWGLSKQETKDIFLKNPLLFFNHAHEMMKYKKRILKYMSFTMNMAVKMLREYPQVLVWSVRSLQEKAIFITKRLQIKMDDRTIQLLAFNFNKTLRPRGQILVKSKTAYNNDNIVSFMKLSDQQFVDKLGVPIQKLNEEKAKFPVSQEMDFRKSKFIDRVGIRQKFLKLASVYQYH